MNRCHLIVLHQRCIVKPGTQGQVSRSIIATIPSSHEIYQCWKNRIMSDYTAPSVMVLFTNIDRKDSSFSWHFHCSLEKDFNRDNKARLSCGQSWVSNSGVLFLSVIARSVAADESNWLQDLRQWWPGELMVAEHKVKIFFFGKCYLFIYFWLC